MKKQLTLTLSLFLLALINPCLAQIWTQTGPKGANIVSIQSTSTSLFAASFIQDNPGGVFRSGDNGQTWENITGLLPNTKIRGLWTNHDDILVSIAPANIGGEPIGGGTYLSTDNGQNWAILLPPAGFNPTEAFIKKGAYMFLGSTTGLSISDDNGQTWTTSTGGQNVNSRQVKSFEKSGDTLFIGTRKGLFRSIDNGIIWTAASSGIPTTPLNANWITSMTKIGGTLYATSANQGVYKSTDLGDSWQSASNGLTDLRANYIYYTGTELLVGTYYSGIFKSVDGGDSWTVSTQGLPNQSVNSFFHHENKLFAGGQDGVFESIDNGNNWSEANNGLSGHIVGTGRKTETVLTKAGGYLFAGTYTGRIYRSPDNGISWQHADGDIRTGNFFNALAGNDNVLLASTFGNQLYQTLDWGNTWTLITLPEGMSAPDKMLSFNDRIYGVIDYMVYYTDDNGLSWVPISTPDKCGSIARKGSDIFCSGGFSNTNYHYHQVYKSEHGIAEFIYMGDVAPEGAFVNSLCVKGDTLFAAVYNSITGVGKGIYRSTDDGVTWSLESMLGGVRINSIVTDGNLLFARNDFNIYVRNSSNGAWLNINSTLPFDSQGFYASGLIADQGKLYAAVSSRSLYTADLAQFTFTPPVQPGSVNGSSTPCIGSSQTYNVTSVPYVTYAWQFPAGWVITAGATTSSVTVTVGSSAGAILVTPSNIFGDGPAQFLTVTPEPILNASALISVNQNDVCSGTSVTYTPSPVGGGITPSYEWFKNAVSTATSETYTHVPLDGDVIFVVMTSNSECSTGSPATSNAITMVVVEAPDAASTVSGQSAVCSGVAQVGYNVATITGADSYVWALPAGASIVSGDGTNAISVDFSASAVSGGITVAGQNLCGNGIVSAAFNVTVNSKPPTPVISQIGITLSSNAPAGNQWYKNGVIITGATAGTYEVTENATYSCIVTINGCSSESSNSLVIVNVGITNPSAGQFEIFPVPSDGLFTAILAGPSAEIFTIRVFNNIGILVLEKKDVQVNGTANQTIDMRPVPSGIYTVTFTSGTSQVVRKMIIKRD